MDRIWFAASCRTERTIKWLYSQTVLHRHSFLLKLLVYTVWKQKKTKLFFFVLVRFLTKCCASRAMHAHKRQNRRKSVLNSSLTQKESIRWTLGLICERAEQSTKKKQGGSACGCCMGMETRVGALKKFLTEPSYRVRLGLAPQSLRCGTQPQGLLHAGLS